MLLPAGVPSSFVTSGNSPGLSIGMTVYDNSAGSPVLVQGPTLMANFVGNAYQAKFTPLPDKSYLIFIAVYTDNSLTSLASGFEEQVESVTAMDLAFSLPVQSIIGYVDSCEEVDGIVNCGANS